MIARTLARCAPRRTTIFTCSGAALLALAGALLLAATAEAQMGPYYYPGRQMVPGAAPAIYGAPGAYSGGAGPWVRPANYNGPFHHPYAAPCPCPCPPTPGDERTPVPERGGESDVPAPGTEAPLPEVADIDAGFASAGQSAAPNMIGDTLGTGASGLLTILGNAPGTQTIQIHPAGGRKYKVSTNNSPLPQARIYYNFHYFDETTEITEGLDKDTLNIERHEFGFEYPFYCDLASIQVTVPFSNTLSSEYHRDADVSIFPAPENTEFGNVSVALKAIMCQNCCKTVSAGVAVDIPTASDIEFADTNSTQFFSLSNDVVTISPFVGILCSQPCSNCFFTGFAQIAFPADHNTVTSDDGSVVLKDEFDEMTLLYLDGSIGHWCHQDCCGNGVAVLVEIHYTKTLDDADSVSLPGVGSYATSEYELLHTTIGATIVHGCWDVTPAAVFPLLDRPDRFFDWEFTLQVNRRF